MSTKQEGVVVAEGLDEQAVAEYLRQQPEFFVRQSALLAGLELSHDSGVAISLIERQVRVLREQNQRQQQQLQDLIQIARDNDRLNGHMQSLSLKFMENEDINDVLVLLNQALCDDFSAAAVTLFLMMDEGQLPLEREAMEPMDVVYLGPDREIKGFEAILAAGEPCCGRFDDEQRDALFSDRADLVASAVVLPLPSSPAMGNQPLGLLAIGSQQPDRFQAEMGTVFLKYLAGMLSRRLWPFAQA